MHLYPTVGNDHPLQYSCLENPMDRGVWWATVHSVAKSRTWLRQLSTALQPTSYHRAILFFTVKREQEKTLKLGYMQRVDGRGGLVNKPSILGEKTELPCQIERCFLRRKPHRLVGRWECVNQMGIGANWRFTSYSNWARYLALWDLLLSHGNCSQWYLPCIELMKIYNITYQESNTVLGM